MLLKLFHKQLIRTLRSHHSFKINGSAYKDSEITTLRPNDYRGR